MKHRLWQCMRTLAIYLAIILALLPAPGSAAPYAAMVMDARTGEILYATNADTRLYPASLTKMLTLYIAFEAIRKGEISLDTKVKVSANAANEAPSKLGLRAGQTIAMRYLIRAAAVKSANDCATAIGEAIGGSEEGVARRMNRTAKALGMTQSTFRNANGLTREGHMSTAHDMTILGRRLFYDFPEFYNIFSRRTTDAGMATVNNTNTRFLDAYKGADGIKTGYTGPAGFNLVASAERGNVRIVATIFGGTSTAQRNAKMAELLDLGFAKAPANAKIRKPALPAYVDTELVVATAVAQPTPVVQPAAGEEDTLNGTGKTIRVTGGVAASPRPKPRPGTAIPPADPVMLLAMQDDIQNAVAQAAQPEPETAMTVAQAAPAALLPQPAPGPAALPVETAQATAQAAAPAALAPVEPVPAILPFQLVAAEDIPATAVPARPADAAAAKIPAIRPKQRPSMVLLASATDPVAEEKPEVVSRMSSSSGRVWGVTLGKYPSQDEAERVLMKTALAESGTLADALRKVIKRKTGFEANFAGMSQDQADLACRRLQARAIQCFTLGP